MKAISVIIPIYNVEPWIKRCLDSLVGQTLKNIELICIDDGSPDNSIKICEEYAARDERIKIIRQENGGIAYARNQGLKAATGEYIGFVDPDDSIDLDFFEKLYSKAIETDANMVKGQKFQIITDNFTKKITESLYKFFAKIPIFSSNKKIKKNRAHFNYCFWLAIYKHDFLRKNKIDFPNGIITGSDSVFLAKAVCLTNKIEFVNGTYYNYFRRPDSLDSKVLDTAKVKSKIAAAELVVDFINSIDLSPDIYTVIFKKRQKILLGKVFRRTPDAAMRKEIIKCSNNLYQKCKYPQIK